jgi:lipopolysaccharide/colanic/teichoic acid biosynthesis glycosyltransferase
VLDVSLALLGLVFLWPLLLIFGLLVKLSSPGPMMYRAVRVGRDGRPFHLYKFRSMVVGADLIGPHVTGRDDPRITPVGRFLRRTKLDELPQLFNVLAGDMSWVGPRPEDPIYVAQYSEEQREVLRVRPGITSPATLAHHHEEDLLTGPDWEETYRRVLLPAKLRIEREYLERRTIGGDLSVLWQTASVLFGHVRQRQRVP